MAVNRPVQVFTDMKQIQRPAKSFLLTSENAHNIQAVTGKDAAQSDRHINVTGEIDPLSIKHIFDLHISLYFL